MLDGLVALVACGGEGTVLLQSCHKNGLSVILVGKAGATAVVEEMRTENAESICISFVMVVIVSEDVSMFKEGIESKDTGARKDEAFCTRDEQAKPG